MSDTNRSRPPESSSNVVQKAYKETVVPASRDPFNIDNADDMAKVPQKAPLLYYRSFSSSPAGRQKTVHSKCDSQA